MNIVFHNVSFSYDNKNVLEDFSLEIQAGKKIAIVGKSGSGKSTIGKLLLRYYSPCKGNIKLGNVDIENINNIREIISYAPQNIELFGESILENIKVANQNASFDEVKSAAQKAGAADFISKLPMQYFSVLAEGGEGISAGEKQRIALSRCYLRKSDIIILDEVTNGLDVYKEKEVLKEIFNFWEGKTVILISHKLSTIQNCDEIIVIDEGKVRERGTHEELIEKHGFYFDMWKTQERC